MSTDLLHFGANERKHHMLYKLGGQKILAEATNKFYDRQVHDERLLKFFHGTDLSILKWHQFNLMSIAFTEVPESFDVRHLILKRHESLFDRGLDETYFDVVMEHFTATLKEMNVDPSVISEAVGVISPLRPIFAQGAAEAEERKRKLFRKDVVTETTVLVVVVALFTVITFSVLKKRHN